jgi:hypothetical protein
LRRAGRWGILWVSTPSLEGAAISIQPSVLGRPFSANGRVTSILERRDAIELEQTACYTCTGWHTCLVFMTESGVRVPLCEACLPFVVERAVEMQTLAS